MPEYNLTLGAGLSKIVEVINHNCSCDLSATPADTLAGDSFLFLVSSLTILVNTAFILTIIFNRPLHTYTNKLLVSNAVIGK